MVRDALVTDHMWCADVFARRYRGRGVPDDDLRQTALLALVEAAERFDPDRGVEFASYAASTIDGTIKRYFRDRTWNVRPPRSTQELHLRVRAADEQLTQRFGRHPTVAEIACELDTDVDHIHVAMEASMAHGAVSIDQPAPSAADDSIEPSCLGVTEAGYETSEASMLLRRALEQLHPRERDILRMRFVEDLTQKEIGDRLGISQSYLSRLLRRSLARIRSEVGELELGGASWA